MRSKIPTPEKVRPVSGRELWLELGFRNERAFQRARKAGTITLRLYPIAGQARGVYARSDELAAHLAVQDRNPKETSSHDDMT